MKVLVMGHRYDETEIFERAAKRYGYTVEYTEKILTEDNLAATKGYDALVIGVQSRITARIAHQLKENGVKYILTKAAGKDHIDQDAVNVEGLLSANVPRYTPYAVAEYAVMMMMELLRRQKIHFRRMETYDFRLEGTRGGQLEGRTIGIIGNGKIGEAVIRCLSGFPCRVLVHGHYPNPVTAELAQSVDMDTLLSESDIISLHCPMRQENFHMIDRKVIAKMKNGAMLVNTARGGLVDTQAVYEALLDGKLGGFAMDVYERESVYRRKDYQGTAFGDPLLEKLLWMDQVIFTAHAAFYTDEAVTEMIETSMQNLREFEETGSCVNDTNSGI